MSKTSQENKVKKTKKLAVEETPVVETEAREATTETAVAETPAEEVSTVKKAAKVRGKKYLAAKKKVDITKFYPLTEGIKLVQTTSFSKFDGKIEAHVTVIEEGNLGEISFPHLETTSKKGFLLGKSLSCATSVS